MHVPKHVIKSVFVCAYVRFRLGQLERVCSHWRSAPGQLSLALI